MSKKSVDTSVLRVGVFDSGRGGLSVANGIKNLVASHNLPVSVTFFADEMNFPYGTKPQKELEMIIRKNVKDLVDEGCKVIIVACNTASIAGRDLYPHMQDQYGIHIMTVTEAVGKIENIAKLLVIGTEYTSKSRFYENLKEDNSSIIIDSIGLQDLVTDIENKDMVKIEAELMKLRTYVTEHIYDGLLLGCTHFSVIKDAFIGLFPTKTIIDPASLTVERFGELFFSKEMKGIREKALKA